MNRWMLILALLCWVIRPTCAEDGVDFVNSGELSLQPSEPGRDFPNWHRSLIDGHSWIGVTELSEAKQEPPAGEFLIKPLKDVLSNWNHDNWDWRGRYELASQKLLDLKNVPEGVDPVFLRAVETVVTFENYPHWVRRDSISPRLLGKNLFRDSGPIIDWD